MGYNVIPVHGTFDIARGRNALRIHIATYRWHPSQGARAGALLTALGELIMSAHLSYPIPIEFTILSEQHQHELWMRCTVAMNNISADALSCLEERVRRAADQVDVSHQINKVCVTAHLYPDTLGEV